MAASDGHYRGMAETISRRLTRRPRHLSATQNMHMQMINSLASILSSVRNQPEPIRQALLLCNLCSSQQQVTQQPGMRFHSMRGRRDVFPGDDQDMRGCDRMKVTEREALVVLEDFC